jgi:hypothetical protein
VVVMKSSVFWDVRLCTPLEVSPDSTDELPHAGLLLGLSFGSEDGGNVVL